LLHSDKLGNFYSVFENHERRNTLYSELHRNALGLVGIDLDEFCPALEVGGELFKNRQLHSTGAAPCRKKIHQHYARLGRSLKIVCPDNLNALTHYFFFLGKVPLFLKTNPYSTLFFCEKIESLSSFSTDGFLCLPLIFAP